MSRRVLTLPAALMAAMAVVASAEARRDPPTARALPAGRAPIEVGATHGPGCNESYSNIDVANGFYFPAGAGVEVLDELHLGVVAVTGVCAFDIGYYKATPGTTDATVTFYANNPGDDPPGTLLSTFNLPGLPAGENGFHVEVPTSSLAQDVWMGVMFNTADTGLLLADPHWPGASDDWFYLNPPGQYYNFGGNPKSDFLLGVYATGNVVAVPPDLERPLVSGFRRDPWPNPSARAVGVEFAVRDACPVRVDVLDVSGRSVAVVCDRPFEAGVHAVTWDGRTSRGSSAAPGVYLVRLAMPGFAGSRKVILVQ